MNSYCMRVFIFVSVIIDGMFYVLNGLKHERVRTVINKRGVTHCLNCRTAAVYNSHVIFGRSLHVCI